MLVRAEHRRVSNPVCSRSDYPSRLALHAGDFHALLEAICLLSSFQKYFHFPPAVRANSFFCRFHGGSGSCCDYCKREICAARMRRCIASRSLSVASAGDATCDLAATALRTLLTSTSRGSGVSDIPLRFSKILRTAQSGIAGSAPKLLSWLTSR